MPTDEEMFDVAVSQLEDMADSLEKKADRHERRGNGAAPMLREAAIKIRLCIALHT